MSDHEYSSGDLAPLDLPGFLHRFQSRGFRLGAFSPTELASEILYCALLFGAHRTLVLTEGDWWGIFADVDWFAASSVSLTDLRSRIVSYPGQPNSMRPETWLVGFANEVKTTGGSYEGVPVALVRELETWEGGLVFRVAPRADSATAPDGATA